ncbi:MAG: GNAT family N-acetyltransferase [Candidatus Thorarchaeota archaeon]
MEFIVGFDFEKFGTNLSELRKEFLDTIEISDDIEETIVREDPSHLIVWRKDQELIGWAIWHESYTNEHRKGYPRVESDRRILENLIGEKKEIIELHELWLKKKYRGNGYGKLFFKFFEDFLTSMGYKSIAYYTDNPAAISICRSRGYKEEYNKDLNEYTFCKTL